MKDIVFGALAPPLHEQLGVTPPSVAHLQADADAVTRLAVRHLLAAGEVVKARTRIARRIIREKPNFAVSP